MKKAIFLGFVVLLALTVFSCSDPSGAPNEKKGIDAWDLSGEAPLKPGEFFVGFNIGTVSGSRALTPDLAKAGSDYFEAVLTNGTKVHRAVFREGRYGRMEAPALGNYDNSTGTLKAYLFAGRNDDKTLLGIGVITNIDNGSGWLTGAAAVAPAITTIGAATRGVEFTIEPLTTDVNTNKDNSSTFKPWPSAGTEADVSARIQIDNLPASIFLLPAQKTIAATYTISTSNAAAIMFASSFSNTNLPAGLTEEVIPNGFIWSDGDYSPITVPTSIGIITKTTTAITFPLTIKTDDTSLAGITSGLGRLSLNVPVVNLSDADADNQEMPDLKLPVIWYVRGGINNVLIDQGKDFNEARGSLGGAILIGVGNVLSGAGGFIIKAGY